MTLILTKPYLQIAFLLNKGFFAVIISLPREENLTTTDVSKVLFSQLYKPLRNTLAFVGPRQHSDLRLVNSHFHHKFVSFCWGEKKKYQKTKKHEKGFSSRTVISRSEWCAPILQCQQRQTLMIEDITSSKNPPLPSTKYST